LKPLVSVASNL